MLLFVGYNMKKSKYYKLIFSYFTKYKMFLTIYVLTSVLTIGISTIRPFLSAKTIQAITEINISQMILLSVILLIVSAVEEVINTFNNHSSNRLQDLVALDIKSDVSKELFRLETKNFDKEGTGFFSSRINGEPNSIAWVFSSVRYNLLGVISSFGVLIYIFIISYKIGVMFLILSTLIFLLQYKRTKMWESTRKEINELSEKYSSNFSEIIRGIRDIKVLNLKDIMINKTVSEQTIITNTENKLRIKERIYDTLYWVIKATADFLVVILGIYLITRNELSGANLLVIYMYRSNIFSFIQNIARIYDEYKRFNLSIERLYEVIDGEKYPKEKFGNIDIPKINGDIEFKKVNFGYNEKQVLNNVSFKIKANETIGFVGKSGQGKSTIFNLLSKLYSVDNKSIFIDKTDINDLNEQTIRKNISVITQDPYIFNLSIKENLKLANPNITDEEMIEKCKLCALHDFVETLEEGYDTKVGEDGVILSGGQKQRLAIARALIKDSEIILLDEATSSLDNETQDYVHESIRKISEDYTILIIAHRLSTVKDCDRIIVVDDGKISDIGTHNELIKSSKTYKELYKKELS